MIVVTGGAGFVGSNVIEVLTKDRSDVVVVDRLTQDNWHNLAGKAIADYVDKDELFKKLDGESVDTLIHLGARTDTLDMDAKGILEDNFEYSKRLWKWCAQRETTLVFASSASVYGRGECGFEESVDVSRLKPLNPYALSKWLFEAWIQRQATHPARWYGLRFFNVYGLGEDHKGRMASMVLQAYLQLRDSSKVRLYRSGRPDYRDGEQLRDFVHVLDVASVVRYLSEATSAPSGLYNVGSGKARSYNDLVRATAYAMNAEPRIEYVDMPAGLGTRYQYFTEADLTKLRAAGYREKFLPLEEGIRQYVTERVAQERS